MLHYDQLHVILVCFKVVSLIVYQSFHFTGCRWSNPKARSATTSSFWLRRRTQRRRPFMKTSTVSRRTALRRLGSAPTRSARPSHFTSCLTRTWCSHNVGTPFTESCRRCVCVCTHPFIPECLLQEETQVYEISDSFQCYLYYNVCLVFLSILIH